MSREDKINELDERNNLVKMKSRSMFCMPDRMHGWTLCDRRGLVCADDYRIWNYAFCYDAVGFGNYDLL